MNKTIIILASLFPMASLALEGNPENECRNTVKENGPLRLTEIIGEKGKQIPLQADDDSPQEGNCPSIDLSACPQKRYLIPGDKVIASRVYKDFTCIAYPKKKSYLNGWVPTKSLAPIAHDSVTALADWKGIWVTDDAKIHISVKGQEVLSVGGNATWNGGKSNIHVGSLDGMGKPQGNRLQIIEIPKEENHITLVTDSSSEQDCAVKLTLLENYLVVDDNMNCGGANVTFAGIYRRGK